MELIFALIVVTFFIILNNVRIAFTGNNNTSSELLISFSTIIFGFVYSLFV